MATNVLIQLNNITKTYKTAEISVKVLNGISLKITKGDFIAITGRSGSGKTTLMNILGLLDTPTTGKYFFKGNDITNLSEDRLAFLRNREIGFVFQTFNLLPRISTLENVILPSIYAGVSVREREKKAKEILSNLGLGDLLNNKSNQLSGGQQQRVAIARALMNDPSIILADEPTGNLDTKSGEVVMKVLEKLNKQGKTIILITHERDIAKRAKKTIVLSDGLIV